MFGKHEHSEALGDVNKAQAKVLAAQHGAKWQERFLRERYARGTASAPPAEAPQPDTPVRYATPEQAQAVATMAGRALLAADEEARIEGTAWDLSTPEEFGPGRSVASALPAAVAGRDLEGIAIAAEDWLGAHGLTFPPAGTERRRVLYAYAQGTVRKATRAGELASLFSLPLFQQYNLPTANNAGRDAAYWVPLLGVYTGARITELAQLLVADVFLKDGLWRIAFRVTCPERQSLKNKPS